MEFQALFGQLHTLFAIMALVFGTLVLMQPKGTVLHKSLGNGYVVSMFLMLFSAFCTYRLYGKFGLFHWLAVISSLTLLAGMIPVWIQRPRWSYRLWHLNMMYWSVTGLYMGLSAEIFTRIPSTPFLPMVIASSTVVYILALGFYLALAKSWNPRYDLRKH